MKAMILAAGEGRRMRPLTLATPKPLLRVGERSLLEHAVQRLIAVGVTEIIINASYLAEQISKAVQHFDTPGVRYHLSIEEQPLETGGALKRALPYLGDEPFILVNGDVWTDFHFEQLKAHHLTQHTLAHLVLVESPTHNQAGDFVVTEHGAVRRKTESDLSSDCLTFSGLSMIDPTLLHRYAGEGVAFPLRDLLFQAIEDGAVTGEYYPGYWSDVGTPERLQALREWYEEGV